MRGQGWHQGTTRFKVSKEEHPLKGDMRNDLRQQEKKAKKRGIEVSRKVQKEKVGVLYLLNFRVIVILNWFGVASNRSMMGLRKINQIAVSETFMGAQHNYLSHGVSVWVDGILFNS